MIIPLSGYNPLRSVDVEGAGPIEAKGLIVVVGPNSSGKTRMLLDIEKVLLGGKPEVVCRKVYLKRPDNYHDFLSLLVNEKYLRQRSDDSFDFNTTYRGRGEGIGGNFNLPSVERFYTEFKHEITASTDPSQFLGLFGRLLLTSLFSVNRLIAFHETATFDAINAIPQNDLQALYLNRDAKRELAAETGRVFANAAWVDHTRGDGKLRLKVSQRPELPSPEDRLEESKVREYRSIESEGDGYKSYVAICVALLLGRRPVTLIDEPELHLHPPQAYALGQFIGRFARSKEQVAFVATHSSHILRGILTTAREDLTVVRLTHTDDRFLAHVLNNADLQAATENPRARTETIFDGIFSEAVAIVEAEGDRVVYQAVAEAIDDKPLREVHFVPVHGTGGIASILRFYQRLRVPVAVIPDYDIIGDYGKVKDLIRQLAPAEDAEGLVTSANTLLNQIIRIPPAISENDVKSRLMEIHNSIQSWEREDDKQVRAQLEKLRQELYRLRRLKNTGVQGYHDLPIIRDQLQHLIDRGREIGLFFVPIGDLENWLSGLMAGVSKTDKAQWADIASQRIRTSSQKEGDVWAFVQCILQFLTRKRGEL